MKIFPGKVPFVIITLSVPDLSDPKNVPPAQPSVDPTCGFHLVIVTWKTPVLADHWHVY